MNASPITKITSWLKFLGKNLHLLGCATLCAKSEVMLMLYYIHSWPYQEEAALVAGYDNRVVFFQAQRPRIDWKSIKVTKFEKISKYVLKLFSTYFVDFIKTKVYHSMKFYTPVRRRCYILDPLLSYEKYINVINAKSILHFFLKKLELDNTAGDFDSF